MIKLLLDGVTATNATKVQFGLTADDFLWGIPVLRGTGYLAGDSSKLYVLVNGLWEDTGLALTDTVKELEFLSFGTYAIEVIIALTNAVSAQVESSGQ
jgi:hypothetical protein